MDKYFSLSTMAKCNFFMFGYLFLMKKTQSFPNTGGACGCKIQHVQLDSENTPVCLNININVSAENMTFTLAAKNFDQDKFFW